MSGRASGAGPVRVRPPATSANLGPGFDALGLALHWHDEVEVAVTGGGLVVEVAGEGVDELPRDERHLLVRALRAGFDALGGQPRGLRVRCRNRIPHARGLGSSSAAIVAGLVAARALAPEGAAGLDDQALLALASELEGHPDNVAACLLGGLTIAWAEDGRARAVRLEPAEDLQPVAFVPARRARTAVARGLLPDQVPHRDAAANAGRAALLVHALTAAPGLLLPATADWLHQRHREPAMPDSLALVRLLRSAGTPAVLSGAGPTVVAFPRNREALAEPPGFVAHRLAVDRSGTTVSGGRYAARTSC